MKSREKNKVEIKKFTDLSPNIAIFIFNVSTLNTSVKRQILVVYIKNDPTTCYLQETLFENINKIGIHIARLTKKNRGELQISMYSYVPINQMYES